MTGGGMGPGTLSAYWLATYPAALLVSATDANKAGDRYATHHTEIAAPAGVTFERLRPTTGIAAHVQALVDDKRAARQHRDEPDPDIDDERTRTD